ncbi:flagellin N-terminal helical domain-containing protein [Frateuria aurantia]
MTLSILTNTSSLTAQNNLNKSESSLASATEDLSSGLKINSSADNAAGYAIATNYTTEIGGVEQASSNASDAISLAQTTTSALTEITSDLQAVRDLAVEAANGTYTSSDRDSINTTVQQYLSEVTQIANQTSFNGINTLNGSSSSVSFQVGSEVGQTITVALGSGVTASQMGAVAEASTTDLSGAFTDGEGNATTMDLSQINIDGTTLSGTATSAQDLVDAINNADITTSGGATVSASLNSSGGVDIIQSGGGTLSVTDSGSVSTGSVLGGYTYDATTASGTAGTGFSITNDATSINGSGAVSGSTAGASGTLTATTTGSLTSSGSDVLTVQDANVLIARIDQALSTVSDLQSNLGAVQDRFQSAISNLSSESTNMTSAQSTVQDADFATETADLSKSEVLEQAGISVLATANSQPQEILKLLQ